MKQLGGKEGLRDGQSLGRTQLETVQRVELQECSLLTILLLMGLPLYT